MSLQIADLSCREGRRALAAALALACMPTSAQAHAWNIPYFLPVPLWLYAYAATGTLIISFMILMFAPSARMPAIGPRPAARKALRIPAGALHAGQIAIALFLALLAVAGMAGTQNPFQNISMSGFWIWFYLGSIYVSAVFGDLYAFVNPFCWMLRIAARIFPAIEIGRYRYDRRLAFYPALAAYGALIALELFGIGKPGEVSLFLLAYAAYAVAVSVCFGREVWVKYFDALGLLCRLCAKLSPLKWLPLKGGDVAIQFRNPIADMARDDRSPISIAAFLSFMLASTAYDALRDTVPWNRFFWGSIYPHVVRHVPALGTNYAHSGDALLIWQWTAFAATAAAYYLFFRLICSLQARQSQSSLNGKALARKFCVTLLPIALFYNVSHYFTLFIGQGRQLLALVSDPLGLGWRLLPTVPSGDTAAPVINMGYIWHAQVLLILAGHVLSVYVTHVITTRDRDLVRDGVIAQLPLLVLTIALTISGLWILSLPLA